ncbi:MAG: quinol:cytochrome C oxidoreductase, partial [Cyclobacteriaceae bacterium]|nr:quinol:cytochrome C oxidoreductase [Cyclobacteriaceae bacterium]
MSEDKFVFTTDIQKKLLITKLVGIVLVVIGILIVAFGGHGQEEAETVGHHFHWLHRIWVNLWINNIYFLGISLTGVLFLAIQYASQAGWSAYINRIPEAFGGWLYVAFGLTLVIFGLTNFAGPAHFHIFHWLDSSLYIEGGENYDAIIAAKQGYLNLTFFLIRMVAYFVLWIMMFRFIRNES